MLQPPSTHVLLLKAQQTLSLYANIFMYSHSYAIHAFKWPRCDDQMIQMCCTCRTGGGSCANQHVCIFFRTYFFFFGVNSTNDLSAVGALKKTASTDSKDEIRERFHAVLTSCKFSKGGLRSVVVGRGHLLVNVFSHWASSCYLSSGWHNM